MQAQNTSEIERAAEPIRRPSARAHGLPAAEHAARLRRIREFEGAGLDEVDGFAAFAKLILAELFRNAVALEEAAQQAFDQYHAFADCIQTAEPQITNYLRAVRQIEHYARMETQSRAQAAVQSIRNRPYTTPAPARRR